MAELKTTPLAGAIIGREAVIAREHLRDACSGVAAQGGRLVALWAADDRTFDAGYTVHVALADAQGLLHVTVPLSAADPCYPGISDIFPGAGRMQRAAFDMVGVCTQGEWDQRKWLRHGAWPAGEYPLRKEFDGARQHPLEDDAYPFIAVQGDGVHEIPVGPVHAGTIEPGHFRFSIIGERVLKLEQRLGYKHKGIEKRFEAMAPEEGARLAGRVSGDSTVAYAWAYCQALEAIGDVTPPARALWLRALFLELERIHNHLGDLGYLGNDVALSFGFYQFWALKEEALRLNAELFGHRYLMDRIIPGGVACDLPPGGAQRLFALIERLSHEVKVLKTIYDEHPGLQDRFLSTGRVTPRLAAQLGLTGMAGRASGQAWDLRAQFPSAPYGGLDVRMATHRGGDVAARATVRFEELFESLRLLWRILESLPEGNLQTLVPPSVPGVSGLGWVEGWRGEVLVSLTAGREGRIHRCHAHDPSWQNWPLLEHGIIGNIVPDFPLINKSFNLSYSGQDL